MINSLDHIKNEAAPSLTLSKMFLVIPKGLNFGK